MIKVKKVSLEGNEINIVGLEGLLSNKKIWSRKRGDLHKGYSREVIRKDGKLITVLTKVGGY